MSTRIGLALWRLNRLMVSGVIGWKAYERRHAKIERIATEAGIS